MQARVQTYGSWGVPSTPGFALALNAGTFDAAKKISGGLLNLRRYRRGNESGAEQSSVGLDFKNVYSDTHNDTSQWSTSASSYFKEFPNSFNTNAQGLLYTNAAANAGATFTSNFTIAPNRAWCIRFVLMAQHEDQPKSIIALMWERWRLEIIDGQISIMRTTPLWTAAKQAELDALRNTADQLSEVNQATADALTLEIYDPDSIQSVSEKRFEMKVEDVKVGDWMEFTFIPEPRGILNILSGNEETAVGRSDILNSRTTGQLWPTSTLQISTNGGEMWWQFGLPYFARTGRLRTPAVKWWNQTGLETLGMTFQGQYDQSSPGTSITPDLYQVPDSIQYYVQADFVSDGNYSPFLYALEGSVSASDRTGGSMETWDSDDITDDAGNHPIMEFSPSYEPEMRSKSGTIIFRNPNGNLNLPGTLQQALHDRMVNLAIDGTAFLTRGIVKKAHLGYMAQATANQPQANVANRWSTLTLEVADQWAIMDSDMMTDNPKGDGLTVGAYIRKILKGAGVKNSEMTGVSSAAGRVLPSAAPGEDFLIQPGGNVSRGDYLRSIVLDWGMGLQLYISNAGIWTLAQPDATVQAAFTHNATSGYRILEPLDIIRDFGDFYNWFCVEGAEINGRRLRGTWTIQESLYQEDFIGYVGRYKRFPPIRNEAIRTQGELNYVLRSRVLNHGKFGRFFSFQTYFHKNLDIGHYVTIDGVTCTIQRIDGGSIQYNSDRMSIYAQEALSPIARRFAA